DSAGSQIVFLELERRFDNAIDLRLDPDRFSFSRKCKKAVDDICGPVGILSDRFDLRPLFLVEALLIQEEIRVTGDDGQRIVQFMRRAGNKLAQRYHLLRLRHRFARGFLARNVLNDDDGRSKLAVVENGRAAQEAIECGSVALYDK